MGLENPLHIAFLILILLLLFGARRIPGMARDLGNGLREFKDGVLDSSPAEQPPAAAGPPLAVAAHAQPQPSAAAQQQPAAHSQAQPSHTQAQPSAETQPQRVAEPESR